MNYFKNKIFIFIFIFFLNFLFSQETKKIDEDIMKKVGQLFITSFQGTSFIDSANLATLIENYYVGGLIFMQYNIKYKDQVKDLVSDIKSFASSLNRVPLFLCIDEEGEYIRRLRTENGFRLFDFSAFDIGEVNEPKFTEMVYQEMADDLKYVGLNFNFAPVVDIDVNLNNPIIAKFKRSFSSDVDIVVKHAKIMIEVMKRNNILTCLKHFPGHGSSVVDSHKGITDITNTYEEIEMKPFELLKNNANAIMVGHLLNKNWDPDNPATVSKKVVTDILKNKLKYNGLIITDDINMRGLTDKYSLEQIIKKSIEAGNDMIIFVDYKQTQKAIEILYNLVKKGEIPLSRIEESYNKIIDFKKKYKI